MISEELCTTERLKELLKLLQKLVQSCVSMLVFSFFFLFYHYKVINSKILNCKAFSQVMLISVSLVLIHLTHH